MPEFTASTGAPRIAAIEYPFGQVAGKAGDENGQLAVLRAVLQALAEIDSPGKISHLPFRWDKAFYKAEEDEMAPPPIVNYLKKNLRHLPRYIRRDIPREFQVKKETEG